MPWRAQAGGPPPTRVESRFVLLLKTLRPFCPCLEACKEAFSGPEFQMKPFDWCPEPVLTTFGSTVQERSGTCTHCNFFVKQALKAGRFRVQMRAGIITRDTAVVQHAREPKYERAVGIVNISRLAELGKSCAP